MARRPVSLPDEDDPPELVVAPVDDPPRYPLPGDTAERIVEGSRTPEIVFVFGPFAAFAAPAARRSESAFEE